MATTNLRSPLVRPRRTGGVVAAAAPFLMLLALSLLAAAVFSRPPVAVTASSPPELVQLTLLTGAPEKGAVCLDGSPPAYHLQRGSGSGSRSWIVYLQGGAWCNTTKSCSERKMTALGSSKLMEPVHFDGILSNRYQLNPDFYDWNKVVIRYCDGASFSGDAEGDDQDGSKLFYRGLRIWEVVVEELMGIGLAEAKQVLLAGCSAGGLATLLHCDNFRARFPQEVSVKCLDDAGFFLDIKDLSGERFMRSLCNGVVHLQNVREILPKDCLAKKDPTEIGNVLAPNGSYPGESWSSCKLDIRNCSSKQIDVLHGFRKELVHELKVAEGNRDWGMFIDSCFTHCQTPFNVSWHSPTSPRLGDKTIAEAVGDWYFGRSQGVKQIDCKYPCNPTCSSQLPT